MRPIKLVMSAFGPYAGEVRVDMDRLKENGIYLITGDTGAGKTTIFDAITFALFGEASGQARQASMLRSRYADPAQPTFVKLCFEYNAKQYTVIRNPEYERPKSRGQGVTVQKADARLILPDGREISRISDVNEYIVSLIGVDRNQFCQISMIAQGDFQKLLLATTQERKIIFQKLFSTEKFYRLQEQLKKETADTGREWEKINSSIKQYLSGIVCAEDDPLYSDSLKAKEGQLQTDDLITFLKKLIAKDEKKLECLQSEEQILNEDISKTAMKLARAENKEKLENSLKAAGKKLEEENITEKNLRKDLEAVNKNKEQIDDLMKKINIITLHMPEYKELEEKQLLMATVYGQIKKAQKDRETKITETEKLRDTISSMEEEYADLESCVRSIDVYKEKVKNLKDLAEDAESLEKRYSDLVSRELALYEAQEKYRTLSVKAITEKDKYDQMNQAWLDQQAGIIAKELKPGKPCPVCGSTQHPRPAEKSIYAPLREELENQKKTVEEAEKKAADASYESGQKNAVLRERKAEATRAAEIFIRKLSNKNLPDIEKQDLTEAVYPDMITQIQKIREALYTAERKSKEVLDDALKKTERLSLLADIIPKEKEKKEALDCELQELNSMLIRLAEQESVIRENCKLLAEKLEYRSGQEAEKALEKLRDDKTELEEAVERSEKAYSECVMRTVSLKAAIAQTQKDLKDYEETDLQNIKNDLEKMEAQRKTNTSLIQEITFEIRTDKDILKNVILKDREGRTIQEKWGWMKALCDTANGNLNGKEKIMLETYVQMTYFDRIIARANQRLLSMTGGQYELVRSQGTNNKSQSGLDLDIADHYNSTRRSARTLSGGESFKASLSLALGLADEVQSGAGGIRMDTLFIDEGFGSLDEGSLEQALDTLIQLGGTNRLVGIISHVPALKERIDRQIIVKKEKTGGSRIEMKL